MKRQRRQVSVSAAFVIQSSIILEKSGRILLKIKEDDYEKDLEEHM